MSKVRNAVGKLLNAKSEAQTIDALRELVKSYQKELNLSECKALNNIRVLLRNSNKRSLIPLLPIAFPGCKKKRKKKPNLIQRLRRRIGVGERVKIKKKQALNGYYGLGGVSGGSPGMYSLGDSAYPGISQSVENSIVDDLSYGDGSDDIADIASDYNVSPAAVMHFQKKHCVIPDQGSSRGFSKSQCTGGSSFSFSDITGGLKDLTSALLPVATTGLTVYQQREQAKALEKQRRQQASSGFSFSLPRTQAAAAGGTPGWVLPVVIGGGGLMFMMMMFMMMRK